MTVPSIESTADPHYKDIPGMLVESKFLPYFAGRINCTYLLQHFHYRHDF